MVIMKIIEILIVGLLALFTLSACMEPPQTVDFLLYVDEDGKAELIDTDLVYKGICQMDRLPSGDILVATETQLILWSHNAKTYSDITPSAYAPRTNTAYALSPDAQSLYYAGSGKVTKLNLQGLTTTTLIDSVGLVYGNPRLSRDGNYLCWIDYDLSESWANKGYIYLMNLQTEQILMPQTGNDQIDGQVTDCWYDHHRDLVVFNYGSGASLSAMEPDGSQVYSLGDFLYFATQSPDGQFLYPREVYGSAYNSFIYRNNLTMVWNQILYISSHVLSHTDNWLFHYNNHAKEVRKLNLESGQSIKIFGRRTVDGRRIYQMNGICPGWNTDDFYAVVRFYLETDKYRDTEDLEPDRLYLQSGSEDTNL